MNPTPEQLDSLKYNFLYDGGANLDLAPVPLDDGTFWVSLHDECGNEIDSVRFDDEALATRFIDWLIDLSLETIAVTSRTFTP